MSKVDIQKKQISIKHIRESKMIGKKLSMVTCYDSSFAKLVDNSKIDIILVGDSLGNVMLGYDNTIKVTLQDMLHHTASVTRIIKRAFVCADMPFLTYHTGIADAIKNAGVLIQQGGAQAVKLEGGSEISAIVKAITNAGIPVMGHLGLTPQSIHSIGGYGVQGKGAAAKAKILSDAKSLEEAGAFAIVLEMMPKELAVEVTQAVKIPTIGIGAGVGCDGQVLVLQDLLGFDNDFNPKFLKKYADLSVIVSNALNDYDDEVKNNKFPANENSFSEIR